MEVYKVAVSEKQKHHALEWDRKNMKSFACRVRKNDAEIFLEYCKSQNTTPGKLLKEYVLECIKKYDEETRSSNM